MSADLYEFLRNFNASVPSHLFVWLSQYPIDEQCQLIELSNKGAAFLKDLNPPTILNAHIDCVCRRLYDQLPLVFRENIRLECLPKCIDENRLKQLTRQIDLNRLPSIAGYREFTVGEPMTVYVRAKKIYLSCLEQQTGILGKTNASNHAANNQQQEDETNVTTTQSATNNNVDLIRQLSLVAAVSVLNQRSIERLLPTTWRSFDRNTYNAFKLTSYELVHRLRTFYRHMAPSAYMLPRMHTIAAVDEAKYSNNPQFICQPNLCGFQVIISKRLGRNLTIRSRTGEKIHFPYTLNVNCFDEVQHFIGAFIIMPAKRDANDQPIYMHKRYAGQAQTMELILLDLYDWTQPLNNFSYEERLELGEHFCEKLKIRCIPTVRSESQLYTWYHEELQHTTLPHFNGFVYRRRETTHEKSIARRIFRQNVVSMYRWAQSSCLPANELRSRTLRAGIMVPNGSKYYAYSPFIIVDGSGIILLQFRRTHFVPFVRIELDPSLYATILTTNHLLVNNERHRFGIVKVRFNQCLRQPQPSNASTISQRPCYTTIDNIILVEGAPDRTLMDCVYF